MLSSRSRESEIPIWCSNNHGEGNHLCPHHRCASSAYQGCKILCPNQVEEQFHQKKTHNKSTVPGKIRCKSASGNQPLGKTCRNHHEGTSPSDTAAQERKENETLVRKNQSIVVPRTLN